MYVDLCRAEEQNILFALLGAKRNIKEVNLLLASGKTWLVDVSSNIYFLLVIKLIYNLTYLSEK